MKTQNTLKSLALVLALALAPAAHAESRDTGVGLLIAAQGNEALRVIRQELLEAMLAQKPQLPEPAPAETVAVSGYGAARSIATTQRTAQ